MNYYNTEIGEENENKIQTFIQTLIKGFSTRELQKSGESDEYWKALPPVSVCYKVRCDMLCLILSL